MRLRHVVFALLVAIPWLWPFTSGPVASLQPYLMSVALAAVLLLVFRGGREGQDAVAWGWLLAALVSSAIGLLQYFDVDRALYPWVNQAAPGTAFGNLRQPNQLATLLVTGLLALRWLRQAQRLPAPAALAASALLVAGLAASASRIGLVALVAVGAVALWWGVRAGEARTGAVVWLTVLAAYVLAAWALPALLQQGEGVAGRAMLDRLQNAESTCGSRLILWSNVLDLIRQKPWSGWGWGDLAYAHYITLYDGPRFCHILDNAHNLPLHLAVELGIPVALFVCGLIAYAVWRGRPWAERDPTRQLAWGVLLAIGLHSLVEYPLWYGPFQIAVGLCIWMLWTTRPNQISANSYEFASSGEQEAGTPTRGPTARRVRTVIAVLMLAAVAYVGWDYHRISQVYLPYDQRSARYKDDAMGHAKRSWLFADAVRFAEVTTRPATRDNAEWMLPEALKALHFSPETRVITKVIESATLLGQDRLALAHLARFKAAFPAESQRWVEDNRRMLDGAREAAGQAASPASAASD